MDDVNNPNAGTQPEDAGTSTPIGETVTPEGASAAPTTPIGDGATQAPDYQKQVDNLNKALKFERDRNKRLSQGRDAGNGDNPDDEVNNLRLENASYKIKGEVGSILDRYPDLPKGVASAIRKNPRGFVNEGTGTIEDALFDIEQFVIEYLDEMGSQDSGQPVNQPAPFKIANTNSVSTSEKDLEAAEIEAISQIPPEEWTPAQEKAVDKYLAEQRKAKK